MSALSDTLEASKLQALEGSGFRWLDRQAVWVHPGRRKVISNEWAHDKSLADLQAETRETGAPGAWSFTSIAPMSDKREMRLSVPLRRNYGSSDLTIEGAPSGTSEQAS